MTVPFTPPSRRSKAFNCPLCGAFAQQSWEAVYRRADRGFAEVMGFAWSQCSHCDRKLLWLGDKILVPDTSSAPLPNEDLNDDIKGDYAEAAAIAVRSPRGAAALLRLALQKLCAQVGESGKDINKDIASLVSKGLDVRVQRALDTLRVVGNEAVHPGELDLRDDVNVVAQLFHLLNGIADQLVTQPRLRDAMYASLPEAKLKGIAERDKKSANEVVEDTGGSDEAKALQ